MNIFARKKMEEFEAANETADALAQKFASEKNDIVCGFLKEKEIIGMMHQEEVNKLVEKFEQEKESMRNDFELEKKDLLQEFHSQQVEKINEFEREQESLKAKHANEYHLKERKIEIKFKEEKSKMRREFEDVIADKNEEIKMLRRDFLRMQKNGDGFTRTSPDCDVYIKRIEHENELKRAREEFDNEKLELERKSDREKAELVQVFTNQTERTNSYFQEERQRIQEDHQKELQFKLEVTERLLSEKFDLEKTRMIQQFKREIGELQESLEIGCNEKLLEKEETIDELEKEKRDLLNALQIERFSLAHVYNRELSLLTKPDRPTKEDVEVALIDEIAKLKQEHGEALTEMDRQHKQKIEVIKRGQQPIKELENKHRKEIENLKKQFESEKESLEEEFRKEQFNLLKSFEFERNDLEQRYKEMINEKQMEIQQKEDDMRNMYEGELDGLKKIVEDQRKELEVSKQKLEDLAGEMEEFASEKNRMEEKFYKENNQCQNLEQNMQINLQAFEKNMKDAEALHHRELSAKMEEFAKEKDELRKNSENEKANLQKEIEILKGRLEEIQKTPERPIVATSQSVLKNDFVEIDAGDIACSYATGSNESNAVENKKPLGEKKEEEGKFEGKENDVHFLEKTEIKEEERPQSVQRKDISKGIQKIQEKLRKCLTDKEKEDTLEQLGKCNKQLKEAINQAILEMDKLCDNKIECDDVIQIRSQTAVSLSDHLLALDDILTDEGTDGKSDNSVNYQLKEKIKAVLNNAHISHEVEKLQLQERHQEEISELLKELADEKTVRVQEAQLALRYLQEQDESEVKTSDYVTFKVTEEKGTVTDDLEIRHEKISHDSTKRTNSENSTHSSSSMVEEFRQENEEMKRSIEELERHFKTEKEELMEKLHTQHKEFAMSADGEIIENLLRQKSTLEEAFNLERFYLGRLYHLEMKDELERSLNRKAEKMKKDHDRDKMDIILKYEKDIADLHSLLTEKSDMELRLLQEKNDAMKKLLATQKRSTPERSKAEKGQKEQDRLEREKGNLNLTIPLKKEIADLQNKRQKEHETAVANLKNAIDLIKEMSNTQSISEKEEKQNDRQRFPSEDTPHLVVSSTTGKANHRNGKRLVVSQGEICNREELRAALENLVELVLNDEEDSVYDSESTSGASSDLESEDSGPTAAKEESDEGAYSGPESTEGDTLNIKKAHLDFAFNLERFNLSRVYYGEYRDSLKKVMRKLAKAKDSLRDKRNDLENEMLSGIKQLVDRTQFGKDGVLISKQNIETQTFDIHDTPSANQENWSEQDNEGERPLETEKRLNRSSTTRGDNEASELPHRDLKGEEQEDAKRKINDERDAPGETSDESEEQLHHSLKDEKLDTGIPQEEINQGDDNNHEDSLQNSNIKKDDSDDADKRSGLPAKRQDDGSPKKPHRNEGAKEEEAFRENEDENEDQEKEQKPETENSVDKEEELGNNESIRSSETCGEINNKDKDKQQSEAQAVAEDSIPMSEHFDDTKEEDSGDNQTENENGSSQMDGDSKGDRSEKNAPGNMKDEGTTEEEACEERDGTDPKVLASEEKACIFKKDAACQTLDKNDAVTTGHEMENKEGEGGTHSEERPPSPEEANPTIQPSLESGEEGESLERNKDDRNSEKPSSENIVDFSGDVNHTDSCDAQSRTADNAVGDRLELQRSKSPVDDKDLIRQLDTSNKMLHDKFSLLCELVGKEFVEEIPELKNEKVEGKDLLQNMNDLYVENEQLTDELKQVDVQIRELAATGSDWSADLNKQLENEEIEVLRSLGEIEKFLRRNDDRELTEHLLKEKENVCTKLDEISNLLNEQKEAMVELGSKEDKTISGLMCKMDVLKDDLNEKAQQLKYKSKMLEAAKKASGEEMEDYQKSLTSLKLQLAALEEGIPETKNNGYPERQSNDEFPTEMMSLVRSNADAEKKREKLDTEIKRTENEIERCSRMLGKRVNRLRPFKRKLARIRNSLDLMDLLPGNESEDVPKDPTDHVDDLVHIDSKHLLVDEKRPFDEAEGIREKEVEIKTESEELDLANSKIDLPYELKQELTDNITTAEKVGVAQRYKVAAEEELQYLKEKINEEESKLREAGFSDPIQIIQALEEKEKLSRDKVKLDQLLKNNSIRVDEHNPEVKQLEVLLLKRESLMEKIHALDGDIFQEQQNFINAMQFKKNGKINRESDSNIKGLIESKENLISELKGTNEKILQSLSTGGLRGPQSEFIEELVEKKVKLEDEIDKLQDAIDDETARASEMLVDLLKQKAGVARDLRIDTEHATDVVQGLQEIIADHTNKKNDESISDEIQTFVMEARLILSAEATPMVNEEREELCQKQQLMENLVKGEAENLTEAKRKGQDLTEIEHALKHIIEEKLPVDSRLMGMDELDAKEDRFKLPSKLRKQNEKQADAEQRAKCRDDDSNTSRLPTIDDALLEKPIQETHEGQNERGETEVPLSTVGEKCEKEMGTGKIELGEEIEEKRRELEESLSQIDNRLEVILLGCDPSNKPKTVVLEGITTLIAKKAKRQEDLQQTQRFEDFLKQMEFSSGEQCSGPEANKDRHQRKIQLESDLKKLNDMIDRRERKIEKIEAKKDSKEEQLNKLRLEIGELDEIMKPLKERLRTAKTEVEAALEETQANISEQEKLSGEEQVALHQELDVLQNEIEHGNQKLQEVEGQLDFLKKEVNESNDSIHADILDLKKLLVEKEDLRDYLAEIDRALENDYESDSDEQERPADIEELREKRKEQKRHLDDLQNKKANLHVEFEDEEMNEVMEDLKQQRRELEERKEQISDKIRGSGILSKLAEKLGKNRNSIPRYYNHDILEEMARDEKTLTELMKERQDSKLAAQRHSENMKNMMDLLSSKIGENLVNSLATVDLEGYKPEDENQHQAVIDEIQANGVTISDILTDMNEENQQLSDMNGELNSDLETLKDMIGEELLDVLLSERLPSEAAEFEDVVDAVRNRGETLESILRDQRGKEELVGDMLGNDLLRDILSMEDKPHIRQRPNPHSNISAITIMRNYGEDLENVIGVYEKELDNLSQENSLLKERLGKDLSRALLQMGKTSETPISIKDTEQEMPPGVQDVKSARGEELEQKTLVVENEYSSLEDADTDITALDDTESEIRKKGKKKRRRKTKGKAGFHGAPKNETLENKDHKSQTNASFSEEILNGDKYILEDTEQDKRSSIEPNDLPPVLDSIFASLFDSSADRHVLDLAFEEEEIIEQPLNAPLIMRASGKTLEDVIAQYEITLEKPAEEIGEHEARMGAESPTRVNEARIEDSDDISVTNETVEGIVDAQKKNMEMLNILRERLGTDLVNALIDDKEGDHLDDLMNDGVEVKNIEMHQQQSEITDQQQDDRKPQSDEAVFLQEERITDVKGDKGIASQKNQPGDDTSNKKVLRAPNIALESQKTLADVIASYEDGLDSLRSKLGPSLTNTLLGLETLSTKERGERGDQEGAKVPQIGLEAMDKEREDKPQDEDLPKENYIALSGRGPVLFSTEGVNSLEKELRAPELMATSGKTLEEVIEDYEDRINEEINELQSLVSLLKEKLGNDLYHTLVPHSGFRDEESSGKDETDQGFPYERDPKSLEVKSGECEYDLKSKSLLQDDGETVENILRKYEKQIDELSNLVTYENDEGVSILPVILNDEDRMSDLEKENKAFADRFAGLEKVIGRNLLHKLESLENEDCQKKEEVAEIGLEDDIKAPIMMQKNDQTLEKIVKNYEKELEALRKLYSKQGEDTCVEDIVRDYEEKIDDLKSKNKDVHDNYDILANRVGTDLVQDILASLPDENLKSENEMVKGNNASQLNAPLIMKRDVDSSLQDVLELYEKALGLFPSYPNDENFVNVKMRTFDDLKRENEILKRAIGDQEATDLSLTAKEETQATPITKLKPESSKTIDRSSKDGWDDKFVSLEEERSQVPKLMQDEDPTITNVLNEKEKEVETVQKLPTGETEERVSIREPMKDLEDSNKELENEKRKLLEMLHHLENQIGPNLTDDLQNINKSDKESDGTVLDGTKRSRLEAPIVMKGENRTLEDVLRNYEKELEVLRKMVPDQGGEGGTISGIVKDYEDKLESLANRNNTLKDRLRELRGKIGDELFEDLQPEVHNLEGMDEGETTEKEENDQMKTKRALKAIEILNESQKPLEDIVARYEKGLEELIRENKVYRDGIGKDLAEALLVMAEEEDCLSCNKFDANELEARFPPTEDLSNKRRPTSENQDVRKKTDKYTKDTHQPLRSELDKDDTKTGSDDLKAISLLRDEGLNLEAILKRYEKELDALGQITIGENEDDVNVADLIANFQNTIEKLEDKEKILMKKLQHFEETVGADLYSSLDSFKKEREKDDQKDDSCDEEMDISVINLMKCEGKNLEDVIKNYEKELLALRKLMPGEDNEIADIVKEYEGKIKDLQGKNKDLTHIIDNLEDNIGSSLFEDLKRTKRPLDGTEKTSKELESPKKLQTKNRRVFPLEKQLEFYEQDLDEKESENKTLKASVGPRLANFLLNLAAEKKTPLLIDSEEQCAVDSKDSKEPFTSMSLEKGSDRVLQSFDNNNNDKEDVSSIPGSDYLKSQSIIRDEGKTVEDVLGKYEKELGTVSKKLSSDEGVSFLDVAADCEEKITKLEKENDHLLSRLKDIELRIGTALLDKIEGGEQEKDSVLQNEKNEDDDMANTLKAPEIMQSEGKTLENVINRYEKELTALRSLVPSDGEEVGSIADIIKSYEDKVDQLRAESERQRLDSDRLIQRIGPKLVGDIKKLNEISSEETDGAMQEDKSSELRSEKQDKDLKVTKIMDVKKSTLEDVLETYESALGALLSDALPFSDELNVGNIMADYNSPIEKLKEENEILKYRIGPTLSKRLLDITKDDYSGARNNEHEDGETVETKDPSVDKSRFSKSSKSQRKPQSNVLSPEELKAEIFIEEEGQTIEDILKNYEKELKVLKSLVPVQPGKSVESISDLVLKYEREIDALKNEGSNLTNRLGFLEEKLGPDLMVDVENQHLSKRAENDDSFQELRKSELQAPKIMAEEQKSLETVINCYEKELDALHKLVSDQENSQQVSISDIIKDYEDQLNEFKTEIKDLKLNSSALNDRLGINLVQEIEGLFDEGADRDESSNAARNPRQKKESSESEKQLKAPKIMRKDNKTLESVLAIYEDALGLHIITTGSPSEDLHEADDIDTHLRNYKALKEENEVLIGALGENLTRDIVDAAPTDHLSSRDKVLTKSEEKCTTPTERLDRQPLEMKAKALMRDNGNTIEDILKKYEEDIEALSKLVPYGTGGSSLILELVKDYEGKLENLQIENRSLENQLKSLRKSIGQDLARDLENPVLEVEKGEKDLKAPLIMQEEGKSLENILRKYERELRAFREADPGQEENTPTITSIVNEYEDKIEELKTQYESLKEESSSLKESIGQELAKDVMSVKVELNAPEEGHRSIKTPKYKATKIMQEKETTLEDVLESYEAMLTTKSGDVEFSSAEQWEILREKVGSELVNELLLPPKETVGIKQKWRAVIRLKEENTTLADILETYELELQRLTREKNAIEALVKDDENNGQSALDVISQYEDEIEHLKNKNIEMENKLSTLIARMGDNLVNDILRLSFKEETKLKPSIKALKMMEDEEKQLSTIVQEYENEIGKLSRENEALKTIANTEHGIDNGDSITNLVTNYEMKIQELVQEKKDIETNLGVLADGVGRDVANEILNPSETEEILPLNALRIMNNEQKTLAEVTKQYENKLESMKREISAMRNLVSEDTEKLSLADKISEYEDEISNLKNKVREQTLLEKRIGMDLVQQLKTLGKNRAEGIVLRAVEVMERKNDTALEDILKDYENELKEKDHEILTLKELVSGDILSIATSQESEIDELKTVKKILANELDVISDKVGRELVNEILNTSNKTPTSQSNHVYHNAVRRMEDEGKSLADVLDEYEKEIEAKHNENEELTKKEGTLTKLYHQVGSDLFNEILMDNLSESSCTDKQPLFEASALMAEKEETLGEVILGYERELDKVKRENGALRALTETEGLANSSATECFSEYEEKIKKLSTENLESNKRLQKLTLTVGVELAEELLKLPHGVKNVPQDPINDLQALRTVKENQVTLANVLQNYENRLKEDENVGTGPLVFRTALTEEVKFAQIVRVNEKEPIITISEGERNPKSPYLKAEETFTLEKGTEREEIQSSDQNQILLVVSENEALRVKLRRLSKRVGAELAEELMRSQEDESNDMNAAVTFASVRELDAFDDVVTERATLAQVLESYEMQLKKSRQVEVGDLSGPVVESHISTEDVTRVNSKPTDQSANANLTLPSGRLLEEVCEINDHEDFNHYEVPDRDGANSVASEEKASASDQQKDTDNRETVDLCDMDISALENLIPKEPKVMIPNEESLLPLQVQEVINEEIVSVERSRQVEHFNLEYMDEIFNDSLPEKNKAVQSEVPISNWSEKYLAEAKAATESGNEEDDLDCLQSRIKELGRELEEVTILKEKYEKDVQDLLQDIVDMKMKQVGDDEGETPEETRKRIKEEIELKQDNKQLQEDLKREKKRRLSIEESKRDLLDELNSLIREKELLLKQQSDDKENGKLLEDMISLRKKLGEFDTENKRLKKEVKELKEALSEVIVTHDEEKERVLEECEKEKSEMMEELVASKRELESQLQELFAMNDDLKGTISNLQEELKESSERFSTEIDVPNENIESGTSKGISHEDNGLLSQTLKQEGGDQETKQGKSPSKELQNLAEQWKTERDELQEMFKVEKERLQKTFDDELKRKLAENDEQHKQRNEEMATEINRKFSIEKKEIKASVEKKIYEQFLEKNIATETDFHEILSKILQEHSKEIENVEIDILKAEERFQEDKNKLLEQNDSEKEALKKMHEEEKKALESTIQNLLKEVVKLKQQRKEIRLIHKKEKETMEEIYERDRIKLKEDWELYKRDLLSNLQEDFDSKLANETQKHETNLEDLKEQLEKSEQRRKELEDRLKGRAIDSDKAKVYEDEKGVRSGQEDEAYGKELRSVKKTLEEEYDKKLKEEKRKFEETLQGLRREIGNLQEKRRLIQDKIYNQDPSLVDRNLVEKSIANYKMEILSKMEEEVAQKIAREKKSLEETISEQQLEIDELKRQRWELRNQLRRDRSMLEEEFELEKERMENQFLKEKEDLKNKLEARLQREMTKRTEKVNRAISPIFTVSITTIFAL